MRGVIAQVSFRSPSCPADGPRVFFKSRHTSKVNPEAAAVEEEETGLACPCGIMQGRFSGAGTTVLGCAISIFRVCRGVERQA